MRCIPVLICIPIRFEDREGVIHGRLTIPCKQCHLIVHEGTVIAIEVVSFGVPPCSIHAPSSSLRRCVLKTIVDTLPGNPDRVDMPAESPAPRANPRPMRTLMSMAETPYTAGKQFRRQSVIWELKPSPAMKNSRFQVLNIYSEQVKEERRTWQVHTHTHADIAALSTIIASAFCDYQISFHKRIVDGKKDLHATPAVPHTSTARFGAQNDPWYHNYRIRNQLSVAATFTAEIHIPVTYMVMLLTFGCLVLFAFLYQIWNPTWAWYQ